MKNKIALEEHFSIEGMTYKNDVMDAPTFADVRRRLVDTESLRIEAMESATHHQSKGDVQRAEENYHQLPRRQLLYHHGRSFSNSSSFEYDVESQFRPHPVLN